MEGRWQRVTCFAMRLPNRPGELARLADKFHAEGIDLLGLWGFTGGEEDPQLSCVPRVPEALRHYLAKAGMDFQESIAVYLQGEDRTGALVETLDRIAAVGINVVAVECVAAGDSFGWFLWPRADQQEALEDLLV